MFPSVLDSLPFVHKTWIEHRQFYYDHQLLLAAIAAAYLPVVFLLEKIMDKKEKFQISYFLFFWNFALSLFSMIGVINLGQAILPYLNSPQPICDISIRPTETNQIALFIFLFNFSKFFELFDTILLRFTKSKVPFLHIYHHITVLLYCWYAELFTSSFHVYFAWINFCIHSIMYLYYAAVVNAQIRAIIRPYSNIITILQIFQMILGLCITLYANLFCSIDGMTIVLSSVMYASYLILFVKLFLTRDVSKNRKEKEKNVLKKET